MLASPRLLVRSTVVQSLRDVLQGSNALVMANPMDCSAQAARLDGSDSSPTA